MPEPLKPGNRLTKVVDKFRYVAVVGYVNDWACYHHYAEMSVDFVARQGDKIGENEARELFPELSTLKYRH